MPGKEKVLILGANGQIGTELTQFLRARHGVNAVIASDLRVPDRPQEGPFRILDVLDREAIYELVEYERITQVYLLAALLSATSEKNPEFAWRLNMDGLFNVLNCARDCPSLEKVFWPSSIAVFGPGTPREATPQDTVMDPNTVYGISKLAGERWCEYYFQRYEVDVRSLRYPGLIGYKSLPGGGTTDYAVDIFHHALAPARRYECFLQPDACLPMMYMEDAIRATVQLMDAPAEQIKIRSSYNIGALSFTPAEIAAQIQSFIPNFVVNYSTDFRQAIADSWPSSIDDSAARQDWGWQPEYDLVRMTEEMLQNIPLQFPASPLEG